jgi:hypothetical protein
MTGKLATRLTNGALVPADRYSAEALKARKLGPGDVVFATLRKPRNPKFHRLAHALGQMLVENLDEFAELDSHSCLKRLQLEADIACDQMAINFPGLGPCSYRMPRSLSFESLDQTQFEAVYTAMCRHIAERYWPSLTPERVAEMAEMMAGDA